MEKYIYRSACELAQLIREGRATSVAIVQEHVTRIKERNGELNAFVSLYEEEALATAAERDRQTQDGIFLGPLHGVPVSIKEPIWIKGKPSTVNAKLYKGFVAPEDAVIVDRIRRSGGVILGKTNVPRFLADYQVRGDLFPEGKNPYNTNCSPGGSTGGGAAAVAAGFSPLELGSDLAGSIRVPASFCGLYGLKPTENTVPLRGNLPHLKNGCSYRAHMAQDGPLARTIEDVETLWRVIVGPHPSDRNTPRIEWRAPVKRSLPEYRIAWVDGWPGHPASKQASAAIRGLAGRLEEQGCRLENRGPEGNLHDESLSLWFGIMPYIVAQGAPWFIRPLIKRMSSRVFKGVTKYRKDMNKAFAMSANHYSQTMMKRNAVIAKWEYFFEEFDFLICPGGIGPAFPRVAPGTKLRYEDTESIYSDYVWPFVACFNASGHPAISIPLGLGNEKLPLSAQIAGPYWSEPELLGFARQVAQLTEGFIRPCGY